MSLPPVFFSYKREDEGRVYPLVRALEAKGIAVWWDRTLPGSENWREQIQAALDGAGCVVVVWSESSVGREGDFVRDEASRGKARGILVPVTIDHVAPPLGFGEIQSIDLSRWNGRNRNDPDLGDFVATVRARLAGAAAPPSTGPSARLRRRLRFGAAGLFSATLLFSLASNLFGVQGKLCAISNGLSDLCGDAGLGGRASGAERLAWEARPARSCAALRTHIARFPDGAHAGEASRLLSAARIERSDAASEVDRSGVGYVRTAERPFASRAEAEQDALLRAEADAAIALPACIPGDPSETLRRVEIAPVEYRCDALDGYRCGLSYRASCRFTAYRQVEVCG